MATTLRRNTTNNGTTNNGTTSGRPRELYTKPVHGANRVGATGAKKQENMNMKPVCGANRAGTTGAKKNTKTEDKEGAIEKTPKTPRWIGSNGLPLLGRIPPINDVVKQLPRTQQLAYFVLCCLRRAATFADDPALPRLLTNVDKMAAKFGAAATNEARQLAWHSWTLNGVNWSIENELFLNEVATKRRVGSKVLRDNQLERLCLHWFGARGYFAHTVVAFAATGLVGAKLPCTSAENMYDMLQDVFKGANLVPAIKAHGTDPVLLAKSSVMVAAAEIAVPLFALIGTKSSGNSTTTNTTNSAPATATAL